MATPKVCSQHQHITGAYWWSVVRVNPNTLQSPEGPTAIGDYAKVPDRCHADRDLQVKSEAAHTRPLVMTYHVQGMRMS